MLKQVYGILRLDIAQIEAIPPFHKRAMFVLREVDNFRDGLVSEAERGGLIPVVEKRKQMPPEKTRDGDYWVLPVEINLGCTVRKDKPESSPENKG